MKDRTALEDCTFFTNNHPSNGISNTFRQFIEALVEEVVINGEPFEAQKKWLRKRSEAEGLNYETLESNLSDLFEAIKELEEHESKSGERLIGLLAKECYLSEALVNKLVDNAAVVRSQKDREREEKRGKEEQEEKEDVGKIAHEEAEHQEKLQKAEALFQKWSDFENPNEHLDVLIESATLGFPKAQSELSLYYRIGLRVQQDLEEAFRWAMASALQNDKNGQLYVGEAYLYGRGIEPSDELAFSWLSKSAENGTPGGIFYLGICYRYGIGTARNITYAEELINQAREIYTSDSDPKKVEYFSRLEKTITYETLMRDREKAKEEREKAKGEVKEEYDKNTHLLIVEDGVVSCLADSIQGSLKIPSCINRQAVISIGQGAFRGCLSLTSIVIPNSVTTIGMFAFSDCRNLTSVVIPNSVIRIGDYAFCGCSSLTSVVIPDSVTEIGDAPFDRCRNLTSIVVEKGNNRYDSRDDCNAIIETANNKLIQGCSKTIIPDSVIEIGECGFGHCSSLTSIIIPNSVTEIGDCALVECSNLSLVIIPDSVTKIGRHAFGGCSSLTSIVIPDSVTEIGVSAFDGCSALRTVVIRDASLLRDAELPSGVVVVEP